jgi:hypothetical protein
VRIQFFLSVFLINAAIAIAAELQEPASFPDKQITGIGVSTKSGRIFVNFPYWSDDHVRDCFADRKTCRGSMTTNPRAPSRTNFGKSQESNANNQLQSQLTKNYDAQSWIA